MAPGGPLRHGREGGEEIERKKLFFLAFGKKKN